MRNLPAMVTYTVIVREMVMKKHVPESRGVMHVHIWCGIWHNILPHHLENTSFSALFSTPPQLCYRAEGRHVLFSMVSKPSMRLSRVQIPFLTLYMYVHKCGKLYIDLTSNSLKVHFALIGTLPKQKDKYSCTVTLLENCMTSLETIGSFL